MPPGSQQPTTNHEHGGRRLAEAILTLMCWLARTDGAVSHRKAATIVRVAIGAGREMLLLVPDALMRCEEIDLPQLNQACRTVMSRAPALRRRILRVLVDIAFADGAPGPAGNHAIRLMADICDQTSDAEYTLAREFERHRSRLTEPGDPTSFEWWASRGERDLADRTERGMVTARGLGELRDLATLGLGPNAKESEIREAFRDAARQCHPDLFHSMSQAAQERAMLQFQRVREAYERLIPS